MRELKVYTVDDMNMTVHAPCAIKASYDKRVETWVITTPDETIYLLPCNTMNKIKNLIRNIARFMLG